MQALRLATLLAFLATAVPNLHAAIVFETVALSGTQAPGQAAGVNYGTLFGAPLAGAGGQVSFVNLLSTASGGVTTSDDFTVWAGTPGSIALVVREGPPAPGTTANYSGFSGISGPDASGSVGFVGNLTGGDVTVANDVGIRMGAPGSPALVARKGDAAPGTAGSFSAFGAPRFNTGQRTAFIGSLTGGGVTSADDTGIWSGTTGGVALLAREGSPAPDTNAAFSSVLNLWVNASGQAFFSASLVLGGGRHRVE